VAVILLVAAILSQPVVSIKDVQNITGLSPKAANDLVQAFLTASILKETTGHQSCGEKAFLRNEPIFSFVQRLAWRYWGRN